MLALCFTRIASRCSESAIRTPFHFCIYAWQRKLLREENGAGK
jgi:hypothetical protein